jgi:TolB-like protein
VNKVFTVVFLMVLFSCSTASNYHSFDQALENAINKVENDLPEGSDIAILDFKSDNPNLSSYIIEELYDKLINNRKLSIMERSRIDTIAMEVGYQLSGEVDDKEIISIGHQLGADYVVTGQITFSGEAYRLRVFAIDIEKGRRIASSSLNINPKDRQINYLLSSTSYDNTIASDLTKIYKIGDTGPAGGIIFYDKGEYSDGWRYMEVAPVSTEFDAHWGAYRDDDYSRDEVRGTRTIIGSGKRNTRILIDVLSGWSGDQYCAAEIVANFNYGGYDDWFIPSKNELDLIYKNIALIDLGGFYGGGRPYGTSSQNYDLKKSSLGAYSWYQFFSDGSQFSLESGLSGLYRLIRQF